MVMKMGTAETPYSTRNPNGFPSISGDSSSSNASAPPEPPGLCPGTVAADARRRVGDLRVARRPAARLAADVASSSRVGPLAILEEHLQREQVRGGLPASIISSCATFSSALTPLSSSIPYRSRRSARRGSSMARVRRTLRWFISRFTYRSLRYALISAVAAAIFSDSGSAGGEGAAGAGAGGRVLRVRGADHERAALVRTRREARAAFADRGLRERATAREAPGARAERRRGADARREGTRDGGHDGAQAAPRAAVSSSVVRWGDVSESRRDKPPGGRRDRSARGAWRSFDVSTGARPWRAHSRRRATVARATSRAREGLAIWSL